MKNLKKIASTASLIGLCIILLIIFSGTKPPNPLFDYGGTLAIILIFISAILYAIHWIINLKNAVIKKDLFTALILILSALIFIYLLFR